MAGTVGGGWTRSLPAPGRLARARRSSPEGCTGTMGLVASGRLRARVKWRAHWRGRAVSSGSVVMMRRAARAGGDRGAAGGGIDEGAGAGLEEVDHRGAAHVGPVGAEGLERVPIWESARSGEEGGRAGCRRGRRGRGRHRSSARRRGRLPGRYVRGEIAIHGEIRRPWR